jgi:predicted HNH restriction endonuclease
MEDLQVHHIQSRGSLGDDTDENLITLCVRCHQRLHLQRLV